MSELKNIMKLWLTSLSLFDNCYFNASIIIILVLYSSLIFENINIYVSELYNYSIIRLIVLLLIIYIAPKDPTISILLGVSYLVSIYYMANDINSIIDTNNGGKIDNMEKELYKLNNKIENFQSSSETVQKPMQLGSILEKIDLQEVLNHPAVKSVVSQLVKQPTVERFGPAVPPIDNTDSNKKIVNSLFPSKKLEPFSNNLLTLNNINNKVNNEVNNEVNKDSKNNKLGSSNTCEKLHISMHEKLSNVCEPVKLFNAEYNVQGLNGEIMGQNIDYHPVGSNI